MLRPTCFFFFFNDTATTEIYTLSLHDALPGPGAGLGHRPDDGLALRAGEAPRVGIVEQGVRPLGLPRAIHRHPAGGVGDVRDRGVGAHGYDPRGHAAVES